MDLGHDDISSDVETEEIIAVARNELQKMNSHQTAQEADEPNVETQLKEQRASSGNARGKRAIAPQAPETSMKRGSSWVWTHFQKKSPKDVLCLLCNKKMAFSSTSTLSYNLSHIHFLSHPDKMSVPASKMAKSA